MNETTGPRDGSAPHTEGRREKWWTFLALLGFSALEIWVLATENVDLDKPEEWIVVGGAIMFPILAVVSWKSLQNDWSVSQSDHAVVKALAWGLGAPIIAIAIFLAGWALFSFFGWLGTIPSWAALIIILLVLLLFK